MYGETAIVSTWDGYLKHQEVELKNYHRFITKIWLFIILSSILILPLSADISEIDTQQICVDGACCSRCDALWGRGELDYQGWYACKKSCGCTGFN